jgi:hypothetical protein
MDVRQARTAVMRAYLNVRDMADKDPEQEVTGIAVPVLDALLSEARRHVLLDDPVLHLLPDLISLRPSRAESPSAPPTRRSCSCR